MSKIGGSERSPFDKIPNEKIDKDKKKESSIEENKIKGVFQKNQEKSVESPDKLENKKISIEEKSKINENLEKVTLPIKENTKDQLEDFETKSKGKILGTLSNKDLNLEAINLIQEAKFPEGERISQNPVYFLSDQGKISNSPPKEGEIVCVFKTKFSQNVNVTIPLNIYKNIGKLFANNKQTESDLKNSIKSLLKSEIQDMKNVEEYTPNDFESIVNDIYDTFTNSKTSEDKNNTENDIESLKETISSLKKHLEETENEDKIQYLKKEIESKEQDLTSLHKARLFDELRLFGITKRLSKKPLDRYINTALFATKFDKICKSNTFIPCKKVKPNNKEVGIVQKGEKFVTLAPFYSLFSSQKNPLDDLIDKESLQEAVIRVALLYDPDGHEGNFALIPQIGKQPIPEITSWDKKNLSNFVSQELPSIKDVIQKGDAEELKTCYNKLNPQAKKLIDSLGNGDLEKGMKSVQDLKFHTKLFDVDLTMPSEERLPMLRCALLALQGVDEKMSPQLLDRLGNQLSSHSKELYEEALENFGESAANHFKERLDSAVKSIQNSKEGLSAHDVVRDMLPELRYVEDNYPVKDMNKMGYYSHTICTYEIKSEKDQLQFDLKDKTDFLKELFDALKDSEISQEEKEEILSEITNLKQEIATISQELKE